MKNQFLSKAVPRGTRTIWRYLSALILLFSLSVGQMWADTEVFSANVKTLSADVTIAKGTTDQQITSSQADLSGGSMYVSNGETSDKKLLLKAKSGKSCFSITNGKTIFKITLSGTETLQAGDVISADFIPNSGADGNGLWFSTSSTRPGSAPTAKAVTSSVSAWTSISYTVAASDGIEGESTFYIHRATGTTTNFTNFVITRSSGGSCTAPTDPAISGASAYTEGDNISLTASATGATSATFTWYKGADWATASAGSSIASGATLTINNCTTSDEGTYWCNISNGTGCEVQVSQAVVVATATPECPSGLAISGTQVYDEGQTISLEATLTEGNGEITYTWYKGSIAAGNEVGTNSNVLTIANCAVSDGGDYFCVASKDACPNANSSSFAVTVNALVACTELVPATSGDAPVAGDAIVLQSGSVGGSMQALSANLTYTANGLQFGTNSSTKASVTLNHLMQETTVISVTLVANGSGARGLKLYDAAGSNQVASLGWSNAENGDEATFTYPVTGTDKLNGTNGFQLWRNNTVTLKSLTVSNCGAELYAINTAFSPAEAEGKATITLSANPAAAGASVTATASAFDPAWEFDSWQINNATLSDASTNPTTITMGSGAATLVLVLKAAGVKHTVTYYDDATELGTELVNEGGHPAGIVAPHKLGYTFDGWSTTNGGAVVALNTISVAANMPLYAVYSPVNCAATSGTIFSLAMDVAPAANCTIRSGTGFETEADLDQYAAISGGIAMAKNSSTSNHLIITTTPTVKLAGGNGKVHIQFDCALKAGDKIITTIASQNIAYTTTDSRSTTNYFTKGTDQELTITEGHPLENAAEMYLWAASSNGGELISINVVRPAKYAVTFNMHDHGDAVDPQYIVEGGKVTEPATTSISGWDFGGWYKESTFENAWDFATDVVGTSAIELHAKWTAHSTSSDASLSDLRVNGVTVDGFSSSVLGYNVELPMGTTIGDVTISGTPHDANANITQIDYPVSLPGPAVVTVTAEDGTTQLSYTIVFSVATSKDINLVFKTGTAPCKGTPDMSTQILSNNAAVSSYINQITFTNVEGTGDDGAEGTSLNVGKKAGNMFTLTAKPGYAFAQMHFLAKIQDANCEFSLDGGAWQTLASTNTGGDDCYCPFASGEVHEFRLRSTGANGVWIRNMQLTMIEVCTPVALAWDEEPVEFEVGKLGQSISATANNGGIVNYGSSNGSVIAIDAGDGGMTVWDLGSTTLSASTPEGDGTTFCTNGGEPIVISKVVSTYFLVKFDAQNGEDPAEVKFHESDIEVALPATDPSYPGHTFAGWFDAATGGNPVTTAFAPNVSLTIYAHWTTDCTAPTIVEHPESANYFTGRTADALECQATAAGGNALTYTWYSCDNASRENPVALSGAPTPSTAVAGTFYFYCDVTEEGCANVAHSDVAVITVADKDPICLAWVDVTGQNAVALDASKSLFAPSVSAAGIKNSEDYDGKTGWKFNSDPGYIAIEGAPFKSGDIVEMFVTHTTADKARVFNANEGIAANIVAEGAENMVQGANRVALTADANNLYLLRKNDFGGWNPYVAYVAVYRACAPILNKVTVAGVDGTPDNTNHVAIEVPASTADAALSAIAYDWISNDAAWTAAHEPAVANAWEWGVENTVTLTDKDGDASVYYVTISKAAASANVELASLTVNGNAVPVVAGQAVYSYELPYGTSVAPTVVAAAEDANAEVGAITANINSATFTVTAEDGTTTRDYTINFSISKWQDVVIWDGSYMDAVATSPDATTGFAWAVTGFSSVASYNATCGTKAYTKTLPSGGGASTTRNVAFTVPAGYVAKFYIAFGTHSDGNNRGMFIGSNATKTLDATSVLTLYSNSRTNLTDGTSEIVGAGTYYLNPMESVDFYEIRAFLRPGFCRTDMLGNGVLGTVCVDHNVAVEDIQGVSVYELSGKVPPYGKIAFDEVVSGEMEAGVPHVFQAHGDRMVLFYGATKVDDPVDKNNGIYGTFTAITLTELDDVYYFAQRALWSCVNLTSLSVPANRAYVKLSEIGDAPSASPAPGRRRIVMDVNGKDTAQGIDDVQGDNVQSTKVLIDGQLFILRGEKMFDATGRLVK